MKIAIVGYGKMGKTIEQIAISRGHEILITFDQNLPLSAEKLKGADVAIEFSRPEVAVANFLICSKAAVPVVAGTTGWLADWDRVKEVCKTSKGTFFYASNFSLGVNLFFKLNKQLAKLMKNFDDYAISLSETHHTEKLDAPSGTAISLAEQIIEQNHKFNGWTKEQEATKKIPIKSLRKVNVPGTHTIKYNSDVDYIEITHTAKSREGFALGAVLAAEFIQNNSGWLGMEDLLKL